jgi:hypothetical protein
MPKKLAEDLVVRMHDEIARHSGGIGVDALHRVLSDLVSRRTLQRRLGECVLRGSIRAEGKGRGIRYRTARTYIGERVGGLVVAEPLPPPAYVPLWTGSGEIVDYVRRPIHLRMPVGYDQSFLHAYVPNETYYLTEDVRTHLRRIGTTGEDLSPAGTSARRLLPRLLIDLSWASSRLEGNTYSFLETQRLIEFGQAASGKDLREARMILNHKQAIEYLVPGVESMPLQKHTVRAVHALLSEGLLADERHRGRVRTDTVEISGSVYNPIDMPSMIDMLFDVVLEKASMIADPFEQAFFLMVHVPYLQPFIDVNKRVSRLIANIPLISSNLCPMSFMHVPERAYVEAMLGVYELRRTELLRDVFVWAYARSCQRYLGVKSHQVVEPDPLRMVHHATLTAIVGDIIRGCNPADDPTIRRVAEHYAVKPSDVEDLVRIVHTVFANIHDGNCIVYKITLQEFMQWQAVRGQ